jgi:ubiquinone/menaquinone biosynthesis C-methylase UbiE
MTETEETVRHPLFARLYLRMASGRTARGEDQHRARLLEGLSGRVIEVGAGNGLNFPFYPTSVEEVLAVEPEPLLLEAATEAAKDAPVPVTVVDGLAGRLPADDEAFEAGVASLVLCSVSDQARALAEFRRVIKRGGELRYYEHVIAQRPAFRGFQRVADATLWPRIGGGCHLGRNTEAALEHAGFAIESQDRFSFTPGVPVPPLPHILGVARRL